MAGRRSWWRKLLCFCCCCCCCWGHSNKWKVNTEIHAYWLCLTGLFLLLTVSSGTVSQVFTCDLLVCVLNWGERVSNLCFVRRWPCAVNGTLKYENWLVPDLLLLLLLLVVVVVVEYFCFLLQKIPVWTICIPEDLTYLKNRTLLQLFIASKLPA